MRWQIENALDARAVHDSDGGERDIDELPVDEDGMPGYPAMAALLRARMRTLPAPNKAPAAHADQDEQDGLTPRAMRALLARGGSAGVRSSPDPVPQPADGQGPPGETHQVRPAGADLPAQGGLARRHPTDLAAS